MERTKNDSFGDEAVTSWSPDNMVEVTLKDPEDFLKVAETLTRMGVASKRDQKLWQSCHILHKQGRYFIVHFKELFLLDGKRASLMKNDLERRNTIASLLDQWNLVDIIGKPPAPCAPMGQIMVIPYRDKQKWNLIPKYNIGNS